MSEWTVLDGVYEPSPIARIREQVALYEATAGEEGGTLEDRPVVILTSLGARSGMVRKNPIMRIVDGDRYLAVASAAGSTVNPSWSANLIAHPAVRLRDGATVSERLARELYDDEKVRAWSVAERFWPHFPEYRAKAMGREIPVFALELPTIAGD